MLGFTVQNFLSAATGIALAIAVTRAFARSGSKTIGNFWVDLTRTTLYVLLPLSIIVALGFAVFGSPQTLLGSIEATTLDGAKQTIAMGPMASQEAIKQLGTNGGGFMNANAAHPFENPNAWTNLLSIFAMLLVSTALPFTFGRMVGDQKQGNALLKAMYVCSSSASPQPIGPNHPAIPCSPSSASILPAATWKARKSASASPCRHSMRSSRRACPAAPSMRCMTPSRRLAGLSRWSSSSLARSCRAVRDRASTA
jgi:hypothetical protein